MDKRLEFNEIKSFEEFNKYYWYREELVKICKSLNISSSGTKGELNYNIKEYFNGNIIKHKSKGKRLKKVENFTLDTPILECDFSFNEKFREFFREITKQDTFKFNADMAQSVREVKKNNDINFTLNDLLDIYYGKKTYAKYDNSSCQWNKFYKDFCADKENQTFKNKMKAASIIWHIIKNSVGDKVYNREVLIENMDKLSEYIK